MQIVQEQGKNQVKVDALVSTINSTKLELEGLEKTKNLKQKELNDVLTRLDFAVEDLNQKEESNKSILESKNSQIESLSEEVSKLEFIKKSLLDQISELNDSVEKEKELIKDDLKTYEDQESKTLRLITSEVKKLQDKKSDLESFIGVLSIDKDSNMILIESMKKEVSDLERSIADKTSMDTELSNKLISTEADYVKLSNGIAIQQEKINSLHSDIDSINAELLRLKDSRDSLKDEVDNLNKAKEDFAREKLAFQQNKEMILLREQYIIEKYNLAGVPYN